MVDPLYGPARHGSGVTEGPDPGAYRQRADSVADFCRWRWKYEGGPIAARQKLVTILTYSTERRHELCPILT